MESKENKILEVKNLTVLIKERFLVKNANFFVEKGECIGVVGDDKSGKTSLIKAISGSLPITEGQVFFDGKDIKVEPQVLKDVSICFDPPVFFKYQTVFDNMKYLSSLAGMYDKERIILMLNKVNLAHKLRTRVLFLSYYEKKLMALALAFVTKPKLLLLDEPFKSLPKESVKEIKTYLKELQSQGTSIILSSRDIENLEGQCSRFIFMEKRVIKEILTEKECLKHISGTTYAYVEVKYPHYVGKTIIDQFGLKVKLLDRKILFEADENKTAEIVKFLTRNKIAVFKAGFINKRAEQIFANLTPYFKEER